MWGRPLQWRSTPAGKSRLCQLEQNQRHYPLGHHRPLRTAVSATTLSLMRTRTSPWRMISMALGVKFFLAALEAFEHFRRKWVFRFDFFKDTILVEEVSFDLSRMILYKGY